MAFDREAAAQRLREKEALVGACPICSGERWGAPDRPAFLVSRKDDGEGDTIKAGETVAAAAVVPVACVECGFLRLFHLDTLMKN